MTSPISLAALSLLSVARTRLHRARSWRTPLALGAGVVVGAGLVLLLQRRRKHHRTEEDLERGPVTEATEPTSPADAPMGTPGRNVEERLDEALEESFPASDPVSVHIE